MCGLLQSYQPTRSLVVSRIRFPSTGGQQAGLTTLSFLRRVCVHQYNILTGPVCQAKWRCVPTIYLFILLTHIVLAALVLPLILWSFYLGLQDNRVKHRKVVRFSYPIWLYVTFTGVVVYLMLSPYYSF